MARRSTTIPVPQGPEWTDVFKATALGGTEGYPLRDVLLSCHADSASALEYRLESPADPVGESAELQPGEAVRITSNTGGVGHIAMRGVDAAAIGGVESMQV